MLYAQFIVGRKSISLFSPPKSRRYVSRAVDSFKRCGLPISSKARYCLLFLVGQCFETGIFEWKKIDFTQVAWWLGCSAEDVRQGVRQLEEHRLIETTAQQGTFYLSKVNFNE